MDGIKIEVTGNVARVIERPARITAGTVGLPVEFSFDSQWEGLDKTAVFQAGHLCKISYDLKTEAIVPWEVLEKAGPWLSIGVYGVNEDGSVAIPTIWANVCAISISAQPSGDPSADPTLPIYQQLLNFAGDPAALKTNAKHDMVEAINEIYDKTEASQSGIVVDDDQPTAKPVLWFNADSMAAPDKEGQMTYIDENGVLHLLHPRTKMGCVDGLEAVLGGKAPAAHTEDKNNPHGVTVQQIGATPASHATNKSNPHGVTAAQVGARPADWTPTAEEVGARPSDWMPTAEEVGAAPAGIVVKRYNISTSAALTDALVDLWNNTPDDGERHVVFNVIASDAPLYGGVWTVIAYKINDSYGVVQAISYNGSTPSVLYIRKATAWGAWEWENPPMQTGIEYRTTERFMGNPVYRSVVNIGYVSKGDNVIAHNLAVNIPTSLDVINNDAELLTNSVLITNLSADKTNIGFYCSANFGSIRCILKYIK